MVYLFMVLLVLAALEPAAAEPPRALRVHKLP